MYILRYINGIQTRWYARVPMIKFKYGSRTGSAQPASKFDNKSDNVDTVWSVRTTIPLEPLPPGVIYDFDLPQRFRRAPISDEEMEAINSGGAMVMYMYVDESNDKNEPNHLLMLKKTNQVNTSSKVVVQLYVVCTDPSMWRDIVIKTTLIAAIANVLPFLRGLYQF
ncbi:hypothetical protein FQR65_LT04442 [Abscondita terminalis]|nr:hypothetical protein FQR65_LT04442 [Abscondita terminalis]